MFIRLAQRERDSSEKERERDGDRLREKLHCLLDWLRD